MNRYLNIVFCILCVTGIAQAQKKPTLIYDFSKGTFVEGDFIEDGRIKPIPNGGFAIIQIININTFRYNVAIEGRSIEYVTQVPSELQAIFRLPASSDVSTTSNAVQKANEGKTAAKEGAEELVKAKNERTNNIRTLLNQTEIDQKNLDATPKSKKADKNYKALSQNIEVKKQELHNLRSEVVELSDAEKAMNEFNDACTAYSLAVKAVAVIKLRRVELIDISRQNWETHTVMTNKLPSPISENDMKKDFKSFADAYTEVLAKSISAKNKLISDEFTNVRNAINEAVEKIKSSYISINEDQFLGLIRDVLFLQVAMENKSSFTVTSPPIQIDGDYVAFNIKATPIKANDLQNFISEKQFPIEIPVKGGLKADFSVGPVISFGKNSRDENYYTIESGEDTVILRQRANNNAISPGLAAMMHFYIRSGRIASIGGMFGVGAGFQGTSDANFSMFFGLSGVIGKRQKIVLSSGVSYLKVERLKDKEFEIDGRYHVSKIETGFTEKVFKPSFFFSVSYNITNKIEIK